MGIFDYLRIDEILEELNNDSDFHYPLIAGIINHNDEDLFAANDSVYDETD